MNQGGLILSAQIEEMCKEYGIITDGDIQRKREIEGLIRDGFYVEDVEQPFIPDAVLNNCYQIIKTGFCMVDLESDLICPIDISHGLRESELQIINELHEIKARMLYFYEYSKESIADRFYHYYLLVKCCYKPNLEPVFNGIKDVMKLQPGVLSLIYRRFVEYQHYIPESVFRALSRGEGAAGKEWISLWSGLKGFNKYPFKDVDNNKLSLCRWTEKYDSIKSIPDGPTDDIIYNDNALDNWLLAYSKDKLKNRSQTSGMYFKPKTQEKSFVAPNAMTFEAGGE